MSLATDFPGLTLDVLDRVDTLYPLPACPLCRDTGFVVVAHPRYVARGRLTARRTCAVICTACPAGFRAEQREPADRRRWTFDRYTTEIGGLDGAELLREFDREQAGTSPAAAR